MIFGAVSAGCGTKTEEKGSESSSQAVSSSESVTAPSESDDTASSSSDTAEASSEASASEPSSSVSGEKQVTGALVMNDGSIFGTAQDVLGTDADLQAWSKAISARDSVSRVLVSTFNAERDLTADEITAVLDTLEGLSPTVMDTLGNPMTGGATNAAAYDESGNRLWSVTLNGDWLIVQVAGDDSRRILQIDETDAAPIQNIAG